MNSITGNTIDSYAYNYANNTNISIQSTETFSSNTATANTAAVGDTIEISTDSASSDYSAFIKTVREVSSETEVIPCAGGYMTADSALLTIREAMKDSGYNVPSFDSSCSSYSDFIDEMKEFISSNSTISFSSQLIDFCDTLKERLNIYGID